MIMSDKTELAEMMIGKSLPLHLLKEQLKKKQNIVLDDKKFTSRND